MTFTCRRAAIELLHVPVLYHPQLASLFDRADARHGGFVTLSVNLPRRPRTTGPLSQNNHVHGHAQQIAEYTGHEVDEIVVYAKLRAVKRGYPVEELGGDPRSPGSGIMVPWSQVRISTVECGYLIDELHSIAAELDVVLIEGEGGEA